MQSQKVEIMVVHKSVGDRVVRDDVLLEVTTDKATIDVVSPCDGIVAAVYGAVGDEIAVGAHVAGIATSEEETRMLGESPAKVRLSETDEEPTGETKTLDAPPTPGVVHRIRSSPAARRLCREHGVTVEEVFAWTKHEPVNEGCDTCHSPHGSAANTLLVQNEPFLCLQCHEMHFHAGLEGEEDDEVYIPRYDPANDPLDGESYPGGMVPNPWGQQGYKRAFTTKCTQCHTQVHGSDSPSQTTSGMGDGMMR